MSYKVRLLTPSQKIIPFSVMESLSGHLKLAVGTDQLWENIEIYSSDDILLSTLDHDLANPGSSGETTLKELSRKIQDKYPVNARQWLKNYFTTVKVIYTFNIFPDRMTQKTWPVLGGMQNFLKDSLNGIIQVDNEGSKICLNLNICKSKSRGIILEICFLTFASAIRMYTGSFNL